MKISSPSLPHAQGHGRSIEVKRENNNNFDQKYEFLPNRPVQSLDRTQFRVRREYVN